MHVNGSNSRTYRLGSSSMFYAPGIVAWAINGASFKRDRKACTNVIAQGWGVPYDDALQLTTKAVPYTVEDDVVVFTVG
jgi:hypothetical protein